MTTTNLSIRSYSNKCWFRRVSYSLEESNENVNICSSCSKHECRLKMNGYEFCALVHYLKYSPRFVKIFIDDRLRRICRSSGENGELRLRVCTTLNIFVRLCNPPCWPLDSIWNYKVAALVQRSLELEKLMWWLSTLGGAFSALGDHAVTYAYQAGRISLEQLRLAFELGDPILICRCKLYMALSFIQTNRLRLARRLIEEQYKIAVTSGSKLLKNCCLGVWSRLQYAYSVRKRKVRSGVGRETRSNINYSIVADNSNGCKINR